MIFLGAAAGTFLRLFLFFHQKSFWYDEWASVQVARESLMDTVILNVLDTHPPLYFILLNLSVKLFGSHEWAFRLPSLLAGMGAMIAVYFCAKEMFDKKTARLAFFFVALSPFFAHLSSEIRNHGLPIFFSTWGTYFFLKTLKNPSDGKWDWAYLAMAAGAVYTDHFAWFWVGGIWIWLVARRVLSASPVDPLRLQIGVVAICLPIVALILYHSLHGGELFAYEGLERYTPLTVIKQMLIVYWHFINGPEFFMYWNKLILSYAKSSPVFWLSVILFFSAGALILKEWMKLRKAKGAFFWFFLAAVFAPVLVVGILNPTRLETRYFGFAAPYFFMLFARGILNLKSRAGKILVTALFAAVSLQGDWYMLRSETDPLHRENYAAMTKRVAREAASRDAILANGNDLYKFYEKRFGLKTAADFFLEVEDLAGAAGKYERVWLLDGIPVDNADFYIYRNKMRRLGFIPKGREFRFGGEADFVTVNLYERAKEASLR